MVVVAVEETDADKIEVECAHCGYEWESTSNMKMVTCPSCQRKTEAEANQDEPENET